MTPLPAPTRPLVRVVVLNFNGGDMTIACLEQLIGTDWPAERLELVLVDNASTDHVVSDVRRDMPTVSIIESAVNRGFAGGCNLGLHDLDNIDFVALVNNDVLVEPDWLGPLVTALESDPTLGAACPRILFTHRYLDLRITVPTTRRGWGDHRELGVRLSGLRVGDEERWRQVQLVEGFWGLEHAADRGDDFQWTAGEALLRVPMPDGSGLPCCTELLLAADSPVPVTLHAGGEVAHHLVGTEPDWYAVETRGEPFEVINNVGSMLTPDHHGADRGYLEPAEGRYRDPEDVFAWCGAAVLLPRRYLQEVGVFDERFFLYYEDLELSWRGRKQGWRYRYVPASTVRHHHSATTLEGSPLSQHHNERNRLLTLILHGSMRTVCAVLVRHLLVTGSYLRRDVLSPLLRGRPVRSESVRRRLRALGAALRLAPAMLMQRRERRLCGQMAIRPSDGDQIVT
ncbi:MAG: glycosyltransferase family 2 protein [Actinobacteria bacterium]|nr:glycosyltransferase family 2 protein [Actinomycetota bacterium]